jgi:hypothetical protein
MGGISDSALAAAGDGNGAVWTGTLRVEVGAFTFLGGERRRAGNSHRRGGIRLGSIAANGLHTW